MLTKLDKNNQLYIRLNSSRYVNWRNNEREAWCEEFYGASEREEKVYMQNITKNDDIMILDDGLLK